MNKNIPIHSLVWIGAAILVFSYTTLHAETVSVEVQENIDLLVKTNKCVGCILTGADLNRLNLSGAELQNSDLSNATFYLADLTGANLTGAILNGTQFGGADLADADLRGADLRGVKLGGAYLVGCKFDGSFSEMTVSDDTALQEVVQTTYLPDQTKPKKKPEQKQVNIADRRDFGPTPPQQETVQKASEPGPAGDTMSQNAPPIKTVSLIEKPIVTLVPKRDAISPEPSPAATAKEVIAAQEGTPSEPILSKTQKKMPEEAVPALTTQSKQVVASSPEMEVESGDDTAPDNPGSGESVAAEDATRSPTQSDSEQVDSNDEQKEVAGLAKPENEAATTPQPSSTEKNNGTPPHTDTSLSSESTDETPEIVSIEEKDIPLASQEAAEKREPPETIKDAAEVVPRDDNALIKRLKKKRTCYQCDLAGIDLAGVNLDGADLEGSDFSGANLEKTDFEDANLKGVSFKNANLKNADFTRADLYKADFTGADVTGATFKKSLVDETIFLDTIGYDSLMISPPQ